MEDSLQPTTPTVARSRQPHSRHPVQPTPSHLNATPPAQLYALAMPQNTHDVPYRSRLPRCSRCFQLRVLPRVARDGLFRVAQHAKRALRTSVPWAGLGSRTQRPHPPPTSQPSAKRPRSAPSVSIYPAPRKPPPSAPASPLPPRSAPSSSYNIQPSPSEPPPPRLPTPLHRSPTAPALSPSSVPASSYSPPLRLTRMFRSVPRFCACAPLCYISAQGIKHGTDGGVSFGTVAYHAPCLYHISLCDSGGC